MLTRKHDLKTLTEALERLEIKQFELAKKHYKMTSKLIETRKVIKTFENKRQKITRKETVPGSGIYIDNNVMIINHKLGQEDRGKSCGVTIDGLIKLRIATGVILRRLPKNLEKIDNNDE